MGLRRPYSEEAFTDLPLNERKAHVRRRLRRRYFTRLTAEHRITADEEPEA